MKLLLEEAVVPRIIMYADRTPLMRIQKPINVRGAAASKGDKDIIACKVSYSFINFLKCQK